MRLMRETGTLCPRKFVRPKRKHLKQPVATEPRKHWQIDMTCLVLENLQTLYLIVDGGVDLSMNVGEIGEQRIEKLEPLRNGEVVGWSAIVEPHIYTLGAQTMQDTHLIVFDGVALRKLLDDHPDQGYYFMKELAKVIGQRLLSKCTQLMSMITE